jgi:hypothetical protein
VLRGTIVRVLQQETLLKHTDRGTTVSEEPLHGQAKAVKGVNVPFAEDVTAMLCF